MEHADLLKQFLAESSAKLAAADLAMPVDTPEERAPLNVNDWTARLLGKPSQPSLSPSVSKETLLSLLRTGTPPVKPDDGERAVYGGAESIKRSEPALLAAVSAANRNSKPFFADGFDEAGRQEDEMPVKPKFAQFVSPFDQLSQTNPLRQSSRQSADSQCKPIVRPVAGEVARSYDNLSSEAKGFARNDSISEETPKSKVAHKENQAIDTESYFTHAIPHSMFRSVELLFEDPSPTDMCFKAGVNVNEITRMAREYNMAQKDSVGATQRYVVYSFKKSLRIIDQDTVNTAVAQMPNHSPIIDVQVWKSFDLRVDDTRLRILAVDSSGTVTAWICGPDDFRRSSAPVAHPIAVHIETHSSRVPETRPKVLWYPKFGNCIAVAFGDKLSFWPCETSTEGKTQKYDLSSDLPSLCINLGRSIKDFAFSPGGEQVATIDKRGEIKIYNLTGEPEFNGLCERGEFPRYPENCTLETPDHKLEIRCDERPTNIYYLDADYLLVGYKQNSRLRVIRISTGDIIQAITFPSYEDASDNNIPPLKISFAPSEKLLFVFNGIRNSIYTLRMTAEFLFDRVCEMPFIAGQRLHGGVVVPVEINGKRNLELYVSHSNGWSVLNWDEKALNVTPRGVLPSRPIPQKCTDNLYQETKASSKSTSVRAQANETSEPVAQEPSVKENGNPIKRSKVVKQRDDRLLSRDEKQPHGVDDIIKEAMSQVTLYLDARFASLNAAVVDIKVSQDRRFNMLSSKIDVLNDSIEKLQCELYNLANSRAELATSVRNDNTGLEQEDQTNAKSDIIRSLISSKAYDDALLQWAHVPHLDLFPLFVNEKPDEVLEEQSQILLLALLPAISHHLNEHIEAKLRWLSTMMVNLDMTDNEVITYGAPALSSLLDHMEGALHSPPVAQNKSLTKKLIAKKYQIQAIIGGLKSAIY